MPLAWLFLILAIATEIVGLTVMKAASVAGSYYGHAVMYASIALSYVFLARAVKTIPVGIAYAIWEGSGVALVTLVSVFVFGHELTGREMLGLAMAVAGILLVNAGKSGEDAVATGESIR
ncbi:SMR family transporter [Sinorhizobium saheli]|uniref:Spermidine export protein MdtJ n=1 Tax=Sinorhizobium saheli TaxID=36856 RepID=A0A178YCU7_SINSA|nr:SMR family transporter [Sinorhizobium saheli]MQW86242.1 QacE family quaternary ammonium compound efflux SMR transporter [Sinorhizobium saheli]OAP45299.1 multidrug transporter [Sinorhizobium saheli]